MKAMILAAGRGERMRPLTDHIPKPLLPVAGKPLMQYTIEQLVASGFTELVINLAYRGQQIRQHFGDGRTLGAHIEYSDEGPEALETAGGIINALPLLGPQAFLVINGDIACDFPLDTLKNKAFDLAHLVMIPNPQHHPTGDFHLPANNSRLTDSDQPKLTFSGIGLYKTDFFIGKTPTKTKLGPLLKEQIAKQRISGEKYEGFWMDIGTPERLATLERIYAHRNTRR